MIHSGGMDHAPALAGGPLPVLLLIAAGILLLGASALLLRHARSGSR